jgi:hypothetical protein
MSSVKPVRFTYMLGDLINSKQFYQKVILVGAAFLVSVSLVVDVWITSSVGLV